MTAQDFARVKDSLQPAPLQVRDYVVQANRPVTHIYFPEDGQLSVLVKVAGSEPIEVGMVGREGMSDMAPAERTPLDTMCQIAGHAHRIERETFMAAVRASAELSDLVLRYENFMLLQLSYTALSHGSFTLEERLARWLLMVHDRVDTDEIALVHDFFSWMLAVRRAGVTEAFKSLRANGCIEVGRGKITIVDRAALIELSSGSYGPAEAEYERLVGVAPSRRAGGPRP
ncbi:MAG: transcriptional regulator, Crp/Fnr family [Hyphomicrobiales bacterium]|nr:transcriptional regulator, Crp/Fnr family [Hyphomicrobiales bacterium]